MKSGPYTGEALFFAAVMIHNAAAQESEGTMPSPWVGFGELQLDHEFETDVDSGGTLEVIRAQAETGFLYMKSPRDSIGLVVRYGNHGYDFGGLNPWDDIREVALSMSYSLGIGAHWDLLAIASVQGMAESDVSWDEGITGNGILAMSYKVSERLTIGPDIGIASQIGDDLTVCPYPHPGLARHRHAHARHTGCRTRGGRSAGRAVLAGRPPCGSWA